MLPAYVVHTMHRLVAASSLKAGGTLADSAMTVHMKGSVLYTCTVRSCNAGEDVQSDAVAILRIA
jgi:hypothetical protein